MDWRRNRVELWIGWTLVFLVGTAAVFRTIPNHDVSWLLYVADRVLSGDRLYVDVVEVNPPLIVLLSLPAAWISQLIDVHPVEVFRAGTLVLLVIVAVLVHSALGVLAPESRRTRFLFVLACLAILLLVPGYDFSQREHLLAASILPYLVTGAARLRNQTPPNGTLVLSAFLASLGLLLKPHFVPAWIALEALITVKTRRLPWTRPEAAIVTVTGLAYAAAVLLFAPSYVDLARLSAPVYGAFSGIPLTSMLVNPWVPGALFAVLLWYRFCLHGPWREIGRALLPALVVFLAAVLIQAKGWTYHWLPVRATTLLLVVTTILSRTREGAAVPNLVTLSYDRLARAAVLCTLLLATARLAGAQGLARLHSPHVAVLSPVVEQLPPNASVYSLSATVRVSFPLVTLHDTRWASRFNSLWLLPGVVQSPNDPAVSPVRKYLFDAVVEDLSRGQPDLLIVDTWLNLRPGFDYVDFLSSDGRFKKLFANYDSVGATGRFVLYQRSQRSAAVRRTPSGS